MSTEGKCYRHCIIDYVNKLLEAKLKTLPRSPGVYFHKSETGEIIYVGKAAVLKNRVRQYFQSKKDMDVSEIFDTDWIETESEIDALFLESEMVKRYMPRFNILLRDDKSQLFVRIDMKSDWPFVSFTRNPADDKAEYFGPYYNGYAVKKALRYLRKVFPYYTKNHLSTDKPDLDVHIGLSPLPDMTSAQYKISLRKLIKYIEGGRKEIVKDIEKDMKKYAAKHDFENAAKLRNMLRNLRELQTKIMFGDKEFMDISKDRALSDLVELLGLKKIPARIEGYDISHMSGTNVVASMVVFTNGASDRANYRKFKTRIEHNDDFYNMNETLTRRLSEKNLRDWGKPDLILIDGGKGQLDAALRARDSFQGPTLEESSAPVNDTKKAFQGLTLERQAVPFIGLAKKQEQIVVNHERSNIMINKDKLRELDGYLTVSDDFTLINLPNSTHIIKLLQRIRDESHRFAVSYHTVLKRAKQTSSILDEIPGVGQITRKKLIKKFGSVKAISQASVEEIAEITGQSKAQIISSNLRSQ